MSKLELPKKLPRSIKLRQLKYCLEVAEDQVIHWTNERNKLFKEIEQLVKEINNV